MMFEDVDLIFKYWSRHPPFGEVLMAIAKVLGIEYSAPTSSHVIDNPQAAIAALEALNKAGIRQR